MLPYFHLHFFSSSSNIFLKYLGFYKFRNFIISTLTKLLFVWKVNTNQFKLVIWNFFIENIQFVYVIVYTFAIFNLGKNIMFQMFKRDLTIVVLVLKKLLGMTFVEHITKRLSFCSILINYESVKFSFKFSPLVWRCFKFQHN